MGQQEYKHEARFSCRQPLYYRSNSTDTSHFWGFFLQPGIMGNFKLKEINNPVTKNKETYYLNIGASGTIEQKLKVNNPLHVKLFITKTMDNCTHR